MTRPPETPRPNPAANLGTVAPLVPNEAFAGEADAMGIVFDEGDVAKLGRYLAMLLAFNETTNLTAVTDPHEAWRRHILDSLTLLPVLADLPERARIIDVGSGGGLPGIPLAITCPHLRFVLLEATGKKADFLREIVKLLGLSNVRVHQERAERAGQDRGEKTATGRTDAHRESYDVVVARAVGRLNTLAELTVPFAKVGGRCALIKGAQAQDELAEAAEALHLLNAVHVVTLDTPTGRIVVLEKNSATPRTYPRVDGEPKRAPLGGKAARPEKSGPEEG